MKKLRLIPLLLIFSFASCQPRESRDVRESPFKSSLMPKRAAEILWNADELEILTLEPENAPAGFHGWQVVGRKKITDAADRSALLNDLAKHLRDEEGALCFDPHHGLKATSKGEVVDLVICFECSLLFIYYGTDEKRMGNRWTVGSDEQFYINGKCQPTIDRIARSLGLVVTKD